ncbi:MAG: FYVE zinc finger domain-containing protein [Planctomycetota bacterium]|jgi:hypothetical protein
MALNCGICEKKMDAFNSVRCRKCRTLVCEKCISEAVDGEGAVCEKCSASKPSGNSVKPASGEGMISSLKISLRENIVVEMLKQRLSFLENNSKYFVFGILLVITFFLVVFMPKLEAKYYRYRLSSENRIEAEFAENALISNSGEAVKEEMIAELDTGTDKSRIRAMRVLGETGCRRALPKLRGIAEDSEEELAVQAQARETIILIEEY